MEILGLSFRNDVVHIDITSCPVRINNDSVILVKDKGSDLIRHKSIHRADGELEEYSYVFDKQYKFIGYIVYKDGFKLYNPTTKEITEIPEDVSYMRNTNIKQMSLLSEIVDPITFKVKGEEYLFKHIIGYHDNDYIIYSYKGPKTIRIESETEVEL